jgi:LacI family transcriptional regulator
MPTTIKEVARKAGVSIATVSRVLNNVGSVDNRTRLSVQRAVRELHYVPNAVGRSLSRRKTEAIGLLLPDLFGEFFSEVLRGTDQTAQQHHYHMVVSSSHNSRDEIEAALRAMRGRVDGLIIMSPHIDARTLHDNLPAGLPTVLLNCAVRGADFDSLNVENFEGARAMTRHLLGHGHRRIAFIRGAEYNLDAVERLRGFVQACTEAGLSPRDILDAPGDFSEGSGYAAARRLLQTEPPPTAIFAANDSMAIGALSALREMGLRVPGDVALAGFDDIPIAGYLTPALTSVRVHISDLGALAMRKVLRAIRDRGAYQRRQEVMKTALSIRASCGCAYAGNGRDDEATDTHDLDQLHGDNDSPRVSTA